MPYHPWKAFDNVASGHEILEKNSPTALKEIHRAWTGRWPRSGPKPDRCTTSCIEEKTESRRSLDVSKHVPAILRPVQATGDDPAVISLSDGVAQRRDAKRLGQPRSHRSHQKPKRPGALSSASSARFTEAAKSNGSPLAAEYWGRTFGPSVQSRGKGSA